MAFMRFARQRWRAWIETHECECSGEPCEGSPVSDGGRGLKPRGAGPLLPCAARFARQRWRAWIETTLRSDEVTTSSGFARQRWRAWIETDDAEPPDEEHEGFARQRWLAWIETAPAGDGGFGGGGGSPVSDGGRGLKLPPPLEHPARWQWFARQRWRAWIETSWRRWAGASRPRFARQRWRAWIETTMAASQSNMTHGSPVSDGGRGLKHRAAIAAPCRAAGSPVSDGGRGLKLGLLGIGTASAMVRPSAMAGVD